MKFDELGYSVLSFCKKENDGYEEIQQSMKDTLNPKLIYYKIRNYSNEGVSGNYEQYVYDENINILVYAQYDMVYAGEGSQGKIIMLNKIKLKYKFDELNNPQEVVLYGESGEPEFMFEFRYDYWIMWMKNFWLLRYYKIILKDGEYEFIVTFYNEDENGGFY